MVKSVKCFVLFLSVLGLFALLSGCSNLGEKMPGLGTLFPEKGESTGVEGIYYAASPDLPLYQSPGGIIVRRLPQYTKLTRNKLEQGYAHVRVDSTGVTGWVENAKLIWRLPNENKAGQPGQAPSQPVAEPVLPQVSEAPALQPAQPVKQVSSPTPVPTPASSTSTPSKPSVAPSIFNPY